MIRILDFSPYYPPHIGGLEKYAVELHENLVKKDCKITVFTPHFPKSAPGIEKISGITIIRYPSVEVISNFPIPCIWKKEFWQQWKIISKDHFDITISTSRFFIQPIMALIYAKLKKIPRIHLEHGSDFVKGTFFVAFVARIFDYTLGYISIAFSDKIIAPSLSASRFVKSLTKKQARVIYRGMPYAEIDAIPPKNDLKIRFNDKKIIIYIGRLIYGKGVIRLLETANKLNRLDFVILIAGDGPEMNSLKKYAKKNDLDKKVIFLGSIPFNEAMSILKVSDIFINPSYNEGLPTSVLEAGVCEKAIIATNVGGTPEIITDKKSGIIIKPYSNEEIFDAIKKLLDNPEIRTSYGQNARREIEQKFNWEKCTDSYLKEINSLIKK